MKKAIKADWTKALPKATVEQPKAVPQGYLVFKRLGWIALLMLVLCLPLSYIAIPAYQIYDERGAKPHHAVGVVTWMQSATGGASMVPTIRNSGNQLIAVNVDSRELYFSWGERVKIGERFTLRYRIGKSGRYYVDEATPMPER